MYAKQGSGRTSGSTTQSLKGLIVISTMGAILSVLGTAEVSARSITVMTARATSGQSPGSPAELRHPMIGDAIGWRSAGGSRPTCMGLPASAGGIGTAGDDVITGTSGRDVIVAGPGNDVVLGRNGTDVVCGGPGDDELVGGRSPRGWNRVEHGDRLSGGTGDDHVTDNWGSKDKLLGGSGDDRLLSSNGTSHELIGGPGADRLTSEDVYDNTMLGGRGPDVLTALSGSGYSRYHAGGPGRDVIDVGPTGDIVVGLSGDGDVLTVHGDAYVVPGLWDSPVGIDVDMAAGTVRRIGSDPTDPPDVITFLAPDEVSWILYGSTHDDRMAGSERDDSFFGLRGDDTLIGLGGSDGLSGFQGDDVIDGGDGDDYSLDGDQGDDVIDGGAGDDSADGGKGTDSCVDVEQARRCSP